MDREKISVRAITNSLAFSKTNEKNTMAANSKNKGIILLYIIKHFTRPTIVMIETNPLELKPTLSIRLYLHLSCFYFCYLSTERTTSGCIIHVVHNKISIIRLCVSTYFTQRKRETVKILSIFIYPLFFTSLASSFLLFTMNELFI